jgi:hypothetical protein
LIDLVHLDAQRAVSKDAPAIPNIEKNSKMHTLGITIAGDIEIQPRPLIKHTNDPAYTALPGARTGSLRVRPRCSRFRAKTWLTSSWPLTTHSHSQRNKATGQNERVELP